MPTLLPSLSANELKKSPTRVLQEPSPAGYRVVTSRDKEIAVVLPVEVFKAVKESALWEEIMDWYTDAHDPELLSAMAQAQARQQSGDYTGLTSWADWKHHHQLDGDV